MTIPDLDAATNTELEAAAQRFATSGGQSDGGLPGQRRLHHAVGAAA